MLPVDPKLGKMLIMGAVFRCLDPVLTVVSGLSVRDPFLLPQDKKDVSPYLYSSKSSHVLVFFIKCNYFLEFPGCCHVETVANITSSTLSQNPSDILNIFCHPETFGLVCCF